MTRSYRSPNPSYMKSSNLFRVFLTNLFWVKFYIVRSFFSVKTRQKARLNSRKCQTCFRFLFIWSNKFSLILISTFWKWDSKWIFDIYWMNIRAEYAWLEQWFVIFDEIVIHTRNSSNWIKSQLQLERRVNLLSLCKGTNISCICFLRTHKLVGRLQPTEHEKFTQVNCALLLWTNSVNHFKSNLLTKSSTC